MIREKPVMKTMLKTLMILASLGFAASAYAAWSVPSGVAAGATQITRGKGAVVYVGTKKAVATYLEKAGACKVSVLVSETYPDQVPYHLASVRFGASVAGGSAASIETSDGGAMTLACGPHAESLLIETHEAVAYPKIAGPATN